MMWHDPFWFIALVIPAWLCWVGLRQRRASVIFPTVQRLEQHVPQRRFGWHQLPMLLRVLAVSGVVIGLARPQHGLEMTNIHTEGVDIILAVDVSSSMLAEDFIVDHQRQNRLAAVKSVAAQFVAARERDRIGLVVFAGRPYTHCPLTLDHGWLVQQFARVHIGMIEDGTAIGSAIATGLNRLRDSEATSRVLILLTDGVNTAGSLTPDAAAELAVTLGVKLYTIGAGTRGRAPYPAKDFFGNTVYRQMQVEIDEVMLTRIAARTGGQYFRATDTASLQDIYMQIDALETVELDQSSYHVYHERYPWVILPALLLVLAECVLGHTWLRVLP